MLMTLCSSLLRLRTYSHSLMMSLSSKRLGLQINSKKTKVMVMSKSETPPVYQMQHRNTPIEQVNSYNYLGALVTTDACCKDEIRCRIGISKDASWRLQPLLLDRKLSIKIKVRLLKAYVWSTLLYGCESWTLTAETQRNLEAVEMHRISYMDHVSNEEVSQNISKQRAQLQIIETHQTKFLGHVIWKKALEDLSLSGKIPGKCARGGSAEDFP